MATKPTHEQGHYICRSRLAREPRLRQARIGFNSKLLRGDHRRRQRIAQWERNTEPLSHGNGYWEANVRVA